MFSDKNLPMAQKRFTRCIKQKMAWRGVIKIDACATTKHKIIFFRPHLEEIRDIIEEVLKQNNELLFEWLKKRIFPVMAIF